VPDKKQSTPKEKLKRLVDNNVLEEPDKFKPEEIAMVTALDDSEISILISIKKRQDNKLKGDCRGEIRPNFVV
jgi:hypothetical protein